MIGNFAPYAAHLTRDFYHLQRSCEGYVFIPVCHSVQRGGGVCLNACWDTTPLGADPPPPPLDQAPPGADTPRPGSPQTRHPPGAGIPPGADTPPYQADGYCCGRYASYWNAFLSLFVDKLIDSKFCCRSVL